MNKHKTKLLAGCLAVGFFMTTVFSSNAFAVTSKTQSVAIGSLSSEQRLYGIDRYETAAKIAQEGWKGTSEYAVLSAGMDENLVDALAAAPLAKLKNAPVLLTEGDALNKYAETELKRLSVKTVYVTTGDKVITKKVLDKLAELNMTVVPLGGSDRFETALNIAKQMGIYNKFVVATALNNADALSVASVAAAKGMPILLSDVNKIPDIVMAYIDTVKDGVVKTYVLGGTGALTDNVKNALPNATRVGGVDRFGTNLEVLKTFANDLKYSKTYLANGEDDHLADALAGSPLAAQTASPVILTGTVLPSATKEFAKLNLCPNVITFGGEAVVPMAVDEQLSPAVVYSENGATKGSTDANKLEDIMDSVKITAANVTLKNAKTAYSVYIQGDNAVLDNVTVSGTLFIDPGANGTANINNVKAGKIVVLSGAKDSIHLKNTEAGTLVVSSSSEVRVESSGTTQIGNTVVTSYAVLDAAGGSLGSIEVVSVAGQAPIVTFKGTFDQPIIVSGAATIVADANASIAKLEITPESKDQIITLDGKFTTVEINREAQVNFSANTTVTNVVTNVNAELNVPSGASIGTLDKKGNEVPVSGSGSVGGSTPSAGGGGGGGGGGSAGSSGGSVTVVSAINITGNIVIGSVLTAAPTPANATLSYQWKSSDTADGTYTNIIGATLGTYTLVADDAGKYIKVTATGTGSFTGTVTSSATAKVAVVRTALIDAISAANINEGLVTISTDGSDVLPANQWVTSTVMTAYTDAIAAAQIVADNAAATKAEVDAAVVTLGTATAAFDSAKAAGIKVGTVSYDSVATLGAWVADRTAPANWDESNGWITHTTTTQQNTNSWYDWQGKGAKTNVGVSNQWKIETKIDLTNELTSGKGVRTSMWVQVDGTNGAPGTQDNVLDWAILQYKYDSTTGQKGWESWDSSGNGTWVSLNDVSTVPGIYSLTMIYDSGKMSQYINGVLVRKYNITTDVGYLGTAPSYVIIQSRTFGEAYTAKWKVPTVSYVNQYPVGAKFISNSKQLSEAIVAQADGQTWVIKDGTYDLPKDKVYNAQGVDEEWYFPIHKSIKIYGEGNPILTSTTYSANGAWASQNFITVFADNVSIQGVAIKTKEEANKAIEILGKNFNLKDVVFLENTQGTSGLIYFNPNNTVGQTKDMGNIILEDVNINKGDISYRDNAWGSGAMSGTLSFKNVTIDNNEYGIPFNYGSIVDPSNSNAGVTSVKLAVSADNLKIKIDNLASDLPYLNNFFKILKPGTTVELAAGTYYVPEKLEVPTGVTLDTTTNNAIIEVMQQGTVLVKNVTEFNDALNGDATTIRMAAGTYEFGSQIRINKAINIIGAGDSTVITKGSTPWTNTTGSKGYAPLITIISGNDAVRLENIKVTGATNITMTGSGSGTDYGSGINVVSSSNVTLNNVTAMSNAAAGLIVNSSTVTANNLNTSANGWYGINVDQQASVPASFTLTGIGVIAEATQIISDKTVGAIVVADGYNSYTLEGTTKTIWSNEAPKNVASITNATTTKYYPTIQEAITAANLGDTVMVAAGQYKESIEITKPIKLIGAGADKTVLNAANSNIWYALSLGRAGSYGDDLSGTLIEGFTINAPTANEGDKAPIYLTAKGSADNKIIIRNNNFIGQPREATQQGIGILTPYSSDIGYVEITNNEFNTLKYAMYFNSINDALISGNTINDTKYAGIVIAGDTNVMSGNVDITNNTLSNISWKPKTEYSDPTYDSGICVGTNVKNITVSGNSITMLNDKLQTYFSKTISAVSNEAELDAALIDPTITIINIAASFPTTKKIIVNRPVVIYGGGKTITVSQDLGTDNSSKHALGIQAKDVTIKDLTINSDSKAYGVQAYGDAAATLENIAIANSKGAGLTVNGSNVVATNLNTSSNAWGGVNVDPGSGVITPSVFTLNGGLLAEATQIWSDGEYVSGTATVMVNAPGYTLSSYTPDYTNAVVDSGKVWINRSSNVLVEEIDITSPGDATTVANGGTLQMSAIVTPSNATDKTVIWSVTHGTGAAEIDASTGFLTATGVGTVTVTATNAASGVVRTKDITVITAAESNTIILTPSAGSSTVKQGEALTPSDTVLSSNYAASGLTTYISLSNSANAPVNFDTVFTSFNLGTKIGSAAFDGPYNMNGPFSTFQYGPPAGYAVEAGVNQITTLTGAVKATAPVGVYTITTEVKSGEIVVISSSYTLTVTIGQNESLTSNAITNFNYETLYATQARNVSKTINTSNFKNNVKSFTIDDHQGNIIPITLNWDIPVSSPFTMATVVGSAVESEIQQYFVDKGGESALMNRTISAGAVSGANGYGDQFYISTFATGAASSITISGADASYFFDTLQATGTDASYNCAFTINDGTNTVTITLSRNYSNMVDLVSDMNIKLSNSQVSATVEKVDDSHFKVVTMTSGIHLTISGSNKEEFFSSFVSQ